MNKTRDTEKQYRFFKKYFEWNAFDMLTCVQQGPP